MDNEILEWLMGFAIANVVAWSVLLGMVRTLLNRAKHTEDKTDEGLGHLEGLKSLKTEQARTNREFLYYIKWAVEEVAGSKPPPYVDGEH